MLVLAKSMASYFIFIFSLSLHLLLDNFLLIELQYVYKAVFYIVMQWDSYKNVVFFCLQTFTSSWNYKDIFQNISLNYNPILEVCRIKTKAKKKKKKNHKSPVKTKEIPLSSF